MKNTKKKNKCRQYDVVEINVSDLNSGVYYHGIYVEGRLMK